MTLESIIERLEKAERGDRALDHGIHTLTNPPLRDGLRFGNVPSYTSSVDAAIDFVEGVLPGWAWKVGTCCVSDDAWVTPDFNSPIHGERLKREFPNLKAGSIFDTGVDIDLRPSGRPAIALCIAVLTALKAKQMGVGE
jgi:hypothetical protein